MKIHTKYHGEVEVAEQDIITFEGGIPGFLDEKKFAVIPFGDDMVISILQSVNNSELAFVIANPFQFFRDYDFTLEDPIVQQLQISAENEVTVYVILTVHDPFEKTTANLQAPIVVNNKELLGKQVILTNTTYQTKHTIFEKQTSNVK